METVKIIVTTLVLVAFLTVIRSFKGEMALPVSICISVFIIGCVLGVIEPLITLIKDFEKDIGGNYISVMLKALGIALITETASDICRDFGEIGISSKIDLLGKCTIISMSVPIIKDILALVKDVLAK